MSPVFSACFTPHKLGRRSELAIKDCQFYNGTGGMPVERVWCVRKGQLNSIFNL